MIAIEFSHGSSSFDLNVCTPGNKLPISRHGHSTSDYIMALLNVAAVRGISLMCPQKQLHHLHFILPWFHRDTLKC